MSYLKLAISLLKLAILLVALGAAAWGGYRWGSKELNQYKEMAEKAQGELDSAKKELKERLSVLTAEHQRELEQLNQKFQTEKDALDRSLADQKNKLDKLSAQRSAAAEELARVRREKDAATGPLVAELQKKEEELKKQAERLKKQYEGVQCLSAQVPLEQVKILNGDVMVEASP